MAFVKKTWKDRMTEFPGRRKLKDVHTQVETVVDVTRNEGSVYETGDAYNAANMNNLEQRIADEFFAVNSSLNGLSFVVITQSKYDALPKKDPNTIYFRKEG